MFLGNWRAEGQSYGTEKPEPWLSTHSATWHTGELFLVQDERATVGLDPFDTLSIMGVDTANQPGAAGPNTGRLFDRTFDNHGFCRDYDLAVDGRVWTITGATERARIELSADGTQQTIAWQWRPKGTWVPLCDRVAVRLK